MLNNFELEHGVNGSLEKNDRIDAGMRVRPFGAYFVFLILISEEKKWSEFDHPKKARVVVFCDLGCAHGREWAWHLWLAVR